MTEKTGRNSLTYKDAGVDIDAGEALVARIASAAKSTRRPGADSELGGFGGLFDLKAAGFKDPILVASTDGVGTKLKIAIETGMLAGIGQDLVAMCVNDLVVQGAEPLFFLDYYASAKLNVDEAAIVIEGIARACRACGCALIGGETAEMPGVYREGELDFAATCVGLVDRADVIDGSRVERGDVIVGFPSVGVHANGFTLVRQVLAVEDYDGDDLLAPTQLYLDEVRALRQAGDVRALAHVTGGGIEGNLSRVLPPGLRARIDWDAWKRPPVFEWLARHVDEGELRRVFNLGIGYCAVVPEAAGRQVIGRIA